MQWGRLTGALGIVGICLAAPAQAGMAPDPRPGDTLLGKEGGLAYVSDPETVTNPEFTAALAACPSAGGRWRITGGGFQIAGLMPESMFTLSASRPLDLLDAYGDDDDDFDDYWQSSADAPAGSTLESFAICARSDRLKHKRLDVPDSSSSDRMATLECSRGKVVGGGGFIATSNSFITSLYPGGDDRWKVRLHDVLGGIGGMEAWAVCWRGQDVTVRSERVDVPAGDALSAFARCRAGEHVTGGGAKAAGAADATNLYASYPVDLGDSDSAPDDGWQGSIYNRSASAKKLKAFAVCAS